MDDPSPVDGLAPFSGTEAPPPDQGEGQEPPSGSEPRGGTPLLPRERRFHKSLGESDASAVEENNMIAEELRII